MIFEESLGEIKVFFLLSEIVKQFLLYFILFEAHVKHLVFPSPSQVSQFGSQLLHILFPLESEVPYVPDGQVERQSPLK